MIDFTTTAATVRSVATLIAAGVMGTFCMLAAAGPAIAAPDKAEGTTFTPTALVRTAGLDLTTVRGQEVAAIRVRAAARRVCATNDMTLKAQLHRTRCIAFAIEGAQPKLTRLVGLAEARRAATATAQTRASTQS